LEDFCDFVREMAWTPFRIISCERQSCCLTCSVWFLQFERRARRLVGIVVAAFFSFSAIRARTSDVILFRIPSMFGIRRIPFAECWVSHRWTKLGIGCQLKLNILFLLCVSHIDSKSPTHFSSSSMDVINRTRN
jgi:hypothetical protein